MRLNKITLGILALLLSSVSMNAQDIHFSQFYLSPLHLNPAMTGVTNCETRFFVNARSQWGSVIGSNAYQTVSFSFDQKIPVGREDFFGAGFAFYADQAGETNFGTIHGKLLLGYSKYLGGGRDANHFISIGGELGAVQRGLDQQNLRWGSQLDQVTYTQDPSIAGSALDKDKFLFLDLAAGIMWYSTFGNNSSFYLGGAMHHINKANQSFFEDQEDELYSKITAHIGAEFMFTDKLGLVPNIVMFKQGPSQEINAGAAFKYIISRSRFDYQTFQLGLWARISNTEDSSEMDALIPHIRFDYNQVTVGFSYDSNVSQLKPASSSVGAFELALAYKICDPTERRKPTCPDNF